MTQGFVHIIESPSSEDLLKGETEGRVLSQAFALAKIPQWYNLVTDRYTLNLALGSQLTAAYNYWKKLPVALHVSMHGNHSGVKLTNNEWILWPELRDYFLPLIRVTQGRLLITMSSCSGSFGYQMALFADNEPTFWALVGNLNPVTLSDLAIAYSSFYHLLFKGYPLSTCVDSMKAAAGNPNFIWHSGQATRANWIAFITAHRLPSPG